MIFALFRQKTRLLSKVMPVVLVYMKSNAKSMVSFVCATCIRACTHAQHAFAFVRVNVNVHLYRTAVTTYENHARSACRKGETQWGCSSLVIQGFLSWRSLPRISLGASVTWCRACWSQCLLPLGFPAG